MEIRTLRGGDDLLAVSRVYEESWKAAYRDILPDVYLDSLPAGRWVPYLRQAAGRSLVLIENGRVVGTSSYGPSRAPALAGWGEIISLYLLPDVWGQGYGGQLLTATVRQLKRAGYRSLFLWVLEENRRARRASGAGACARCSTAIPPIPAGARPRAKTGPGGRR